MNWIVEILNAVDIMTLNYVSTTYQALAGKFEPTMRILMTLYFVTFGIAVFKGYIQIPIQEYVNRMLRAILIFFVLMNYDSFSRFVAEAFLSFPDAIGIELIQAMNSVTSAAPRPTSINIGTSGMGNVLMALWDNGGQVISVVFSEVGKVWGTVIGLLLGTTTGIMIALSIVLLLYAKFAMALLLGLTPIFLLTFVFDFTKGLFEGWFRALWMTVLLPIFTYSIIAFVFFLTDSTAQLTIRLVENSKNFQLSDIGPIFIGYIIGIILLFQVKELAYGIAGGFRMAGGSLIQPVKDAVSKSAKSAKSRFSNTDKSQARQQQKEEAKQRRIDTIKAKKS